jgi:hypothetical protein
MIGNVDYLVPHEGQHTARPYRTCALRRLLNPNDYSQPLYDKYRESFEEYIISTVSNAITCWTRYIT